MLPLLGRDEIARELADLLGGSSRLVTLVGPGGVGKTRLALSLAFARAEPPRWVELAALRRGESVATIVSEALGVDSLEDSPLPEDTLLVVDNCEHVLDDAAKALERALATFPGLRVMATSREPLGVAAEHVVPLAPLRLPRSDEPSEVEGSPAIQLFLARAEQAGASARPAATELSAIHRLCRRLDGLPLAIEIAASRARSVSAAEMLARLDDDLGLLVSPSRSGDARHQSLRSTIEWSYRLLDEADQRLFDQLSVVPGRFSLDAVEHFCETEGFGRRNALDMIERLVQRSLVVAESIGDITWYRLLETLAGFGRDQLEAREELVRARDRSVDYAVAMATRAIEASPAGVPGALLTRLYLSSPLLRESILWCLERDPGPTRAFTIAVVLWTIATQEHAQEISELTRRVLERWPGSDEPLRPLVVASLATSLKSGGDRADEARALVDEVIDAGTGGPYASIAEVLAIRAVASNSVRVADASGRDWVDRALVGAREVAPGFVPEFLLIRAELSSQLGEFDQALADTREALTLAEELGIDYAVAWGLAVRAYLRKLSDPVASRGDSEASLELSERIGFGLGVGHMLVNLGIVHLVQGDVPAAVEHLARSLSHWRRSGDAMMVGAVLREVSTLLAVVGRIEDAATLRSAIDTGGRCHAPWGEDAQVLTGRDRIIREGLADADIALAARRAATWTRRETIQWGERCLAELGGAKDLAIVHPIASGSLGAPGGDAAPDPAPTGKAEGRGRGVFRREGDLWRLRYGDEECHVVGRKGIVDLARLLGHPNESLHCLELTGRSAEQDAGADVFDDRARREIRLRAEALREELEDAQERGDTDRAERAREELERLEDAVAASLGLGGRSRRLGSEAERARSTVTARIRAAIKQIEHQHARLGRHLRASVRTGTWCVYAPEEPVDWRL